MSQIVPIFQLKNPQSPRSLVMMKAHFKNQRFVYSTGLFIEPKYWDDILKRPITEKLALLKKESKENPDRITEKNILLNEIRDAKIVNVRFEAEMLHISKEIERYNFQLNAKYEYLINQGKNPTMDLLRDELNKVFRPKIKKELENDFFVIFDEFISIRQKQHAITTIKKHTTLKKVLLDFQKKCHYKIEFNSIDLKFYEKFKNFLLEKGLLDDTISKYFKSIKTYMQWSLDRDYHTNRIFKHPDFSAREKIKHQIITLSLQEFKRIQDLNLSANLRLEKVRDIFVFSTFTGQRITDVLNIKKTDLEGSIWNLKQKKTGKPVRIPLNDLPGAMDILKKYNFRFPDISDQKYNLYLKEIGQLANIDEIVTKKRTSGKKLIETSLPKYKFMSSHIARRTCITIMLEAGIPPTTIMMLTGQTDIKTMMRYENTGEEALKLALKGFWRGK